MFTTSEIRDLQDLVTTLQFEVNKLQKNAIKTKNFMREVNRTVYGKDSSRFIWPEIGMESRVRMLWKKAGLQDENLGLLMDHCGLEFVDLKAKRIIHYKENDDA